VGFGKLNTGFQLGQHLPAAVAKFDPNLQIRYRHRNMHPAQTTGEGCLHICDATPVPPQQLRLETQLHQGLDGSCLLPAHRWDAYLQFGDTNCIQKLGNRHLFRTTKGNSCCLLPIPQGGVVNPNQMPHKRLTPLVRPVTLGMCAKQTPEKQPKNQQVNQ
jgi:hypothetical protein